MLYFISASVSSPSPNLDLWATVSFSVSEKDSWLLVLATSNKSLISLRSFLSLDGILHFFYTPHFITVIWRVLHTSLKKKIFYLLLVWNVDFISSGPRFLSCHHNIKNSERQLQIKLKANLQVLFFGIVDFLPWRRSTDWLTWWFPLWLCFLCFCDRMNICVGKCIFDIFVSDVLHSEILFFFIDILCSLAKWPPFCFMVKIIECKLWMWGIGVSTVPDDK